ncbi:hypothetical protein HYT60_02090 [Candidatus Woesebacteria bacterium]|nr:hypothetical protein [Candidatus Woesebacteria bacterium]
MTALEQEPTGIAEHREEEFQAAKKHLEARGSDPRSLDFLRKWGRLTFGGLDGTFYFKKYRRSEISEGRIYPFLEVNYFSPGIPPERPVRLSIRHARWGDLPQFELEAVPVSVVSLEEGPTGTMVVFAAPWDVAKVKISEDGSLFLEGLIPPPPLPETPL